ncbi:MAG: hypothetical protein ACI9JO_000384, partial [Psychrobacter okhotskensis]
GIAYSKNIKSTKYQVQKIPRPTIPLVGQNCFNQAVLYLRQ